MSRDLRKAFVLPLVFLLLLPLPNVSAAQDLPSQEGPELTQEEKDAQEIGYRVGSVFASVLYSPLKVTYAGLGLITGGLGFMLTGGRRDVANNIINPSVRGDYVITPNHLKGVEPVIFIGPPPPDSQPSPLARPNSPSVR